MSIAAGDVRLEHGRLVLNGVVLLAFQRVRRTELRSADHAQEPPSDDAGQDRWSPPSTRGNSLGISAMHACLSAQGAKDWGSREPRSFAACLLHDEALWLGLHSLNPQRAVHLRVVIVDQSSVGHSTPRAQRLRAAIPPAFALTEEETVDEDTGASARPRLFWHPPCQLAVRAGGTGARLFLLDQDAFASATGAAAPPPARPEHGYRGWRLP